MPKERQEEFDEVREIQQGLRPIDDACFEVLMQEKGVCEEILRVILDDPDLVVETLVAQDNIRNLFGRGVRLDALCTLGDGRTCNVEVQKADNDDHPRRCRYNEACITANMENPKDLFADVPNVCIIYISTFDVLGVGKTICHAHMRVDETGEVLDDGVEYIFVNTKIKDGTKISNLMEEFLKTEVQNPEFPKLSDKMHRFKDDEKEVSDMCTAIENYANEKRDKERLRTVTEMISKNFTNDQILSLGFTMEEIEKSSASIHKQN